MQGANKQRYELFIVQRVTHDYDSRQTRTNFGASNVIFGVLGQSRVSFSGYVQIVKSSPFPRASSLEELPFLWLVVFR